MRNTILSERTARAIDQQVERVLRDLRNPEPPLRLEEVRELLKLDRKYYSATDHGLLQEVTHKLSVAGKQVLQRPMLLWDVVKKRDLKALWVPDRKRILIDSTLPEAKQRWGEGHEIGHSLLDWHDAMTHGDARATLSLGCEEKLEAEANYAAGRLLFLRDRFHEELVSAPVTFARVREMSSVYGNTMTSSLYRTVESLDVPAVGIISAHPWAKREDGTESVRHLIRSAQFAVQFATISEDELYRKLAKVVFRRGGGPIGENQMVLADINGDEHDFHFECFSNGHDTLAFGMHTRRHAVVVGTSR